jgi:hypothetical protein
MTDSSLDARFARNPLSAAAGGPIGFFASANMYLPCPGSGDVLPIGSFCLLQKEPREALTEVQKEMLESFAKLATQECASLPFLGCSLAALSLSTHTDALLSLLTVELAFEKERNRQAANQHLFIQNLFRNLLIYPSRSVDTSKPRYTLDDLAREVGQQTSSDFSFILDTRAFNAQLPATDTTAASSSSPTRSVSKPAFNRRPSSESNSSVSDFPRPHWSRRDPTIHGLGEVTLMDAWYGETFSGGGADEALAAGAERRRTQLEGREWAGLVNEALAAYHVVRTLLSLFSLQAG